MHDYGRRTVGNWSIIGMDRNSINIYALTSYKVHTQNLINFISQIQFGMTDL